MGYPIIEIPGLDAEQEDLLHRHGIHTSLQLLEACRLPRGRKNVALQTGIGDERLLKWTHCADLLRVKGIAGQYLALLEASGVSSIKDLRSSKADALSQAMREANERRKLCKVSPSVAVVRKWMDLARALPAKVTP